MKDTNRKAPLSLQHVSTLCSSVGTLKAGLLPGVEAGSGRFHAMFKRGHIEGPLKKKPCIMGARFHAMFKRGHIEGYKSKSSPISSARFHAMFKRGHIEGYGCVLHTTTARSFHAMFKRGHIEGCFMLGSLNLQIYILRQYFIISQYLHRLTSTTAGMESESVILRIRSTSFFNSAFSSGCTFTQNTCLLGRR